MSPSISTKTAEPWVLFEALIDNWGKVVGLEQNERSKELMFPSLLIVTYVGIILLILYCAPGIRWSSHELDQDQHPVSSIHVWIITVLGFVYVLLATILTRVAYFDSSYSLICEPYTPYPPDGFWDKTHLFFSGVKPHLKFGSTKFNMNKIVVMTLYVHIVKIIELMTLLCNKNRQGLQVYHHVSVILVTMLAVKFVPGGNSVFPLTVNCWTSVIAYGSYIFKKLHGNLVDVKLIIQYSVMVQFGLIAIHAAVGLIADCGYPKWILVGTILYMLSFFAIIAFKTATHRPMSYELGIDNF